MKDRVSAKPNRYAVYDDAHNFLRYEYHERADEPTQVGDPLNKANLLPDTVATSLGLTGNPQVKDALLSLNTLSSTKAKIETGSYTGTDVFGASDSVFSDSSASLTCGLPVRPRDVATVSGRRLALFSGSPTCVGSSARSWYSYLKKLCASS